MNQGFCGELVWGGSDKIFWCWCVWKNARGSSQIKGLNTSTNKLCNVWSIWGMTSSERHRWTNFKSKKAPSNVVNWCEQATEQRSGSTVPVWRPQTTWCVRTWDFYTQKRSNSVQHFCLLTIKNENKHGNKKQAPTRVLPLSLWRPCSPRVPSDWHACTRKPQRWRGGACWQAVRGQQGLFDRGRGPSGHWALERLCNGADLQENKSPLYFTHMFNCTKTNRPRNRK